MGASLESPDSSMARVLAGTGFRHDLAVLLRGGMHSKHCCRMMIRG